MIERFKELNIILKILIGIIAVWLWPFALILLSIDLVVTGLKKKQKGKIIIGIICTIIFGIMLLNISCVDKNIPQEDVNSNNILKMEPTVENIQYALIENGFDIKEVYIATYDDKLAIDLYSNINSNSLYKKGFEIINFLENNFDIDKGYWIAGFNEDTFFGSFRIDREDINSDLTLEILKEVAHSQNGILE